MNLSDLWPVFRHVLVTAILLAAMWDVSREKHKPEKAKQKSRKDVILDAEYEVID